MNSQKFARILSAIQILLFSIFALDVFGQDYSFTTLLVALFIHLIPGLFLLILLLISIKDPKLTGSIYLLTSIAFTTIFKSYTSIPSFLFITGFTIIIGLLYLKEPKDQKTQPPQQNYQ